VAVVFWFFFMVFWFVAVAVQFVVFWFVGVVVQFVVFWFMAVVIQFVVFWFVTSYTLAGGYNCIRRLCLNPEDVGSLFLRNSGICLQDYIMSQPREP
jgi:hypothetical protein